jgi:stress responsive alpha/beta barrel protein
LTRALATHRCCTAALCQLPGLIPEIRSFKCGPDVGVNAGNWDFAVAAEFDSIDDQTVYREHRVHQRVMPDLIAPIRADWAAVQCDAG